MKSAYATRLISIGWYWSINSDQRCTELSQSRHDASFSIFFSSTRLFIPVRLLASDRPQLKDIHREHPLAPLLSLPLLRLLFFRSFLLFSLFGVTNMPTCFTYSFWKFASRDLCFLFYDERRGMNFYVSFSDLLSTFENFKIFVDFRGFWWNRTVTGL